MISGSDIYNEAISLLKKLITTPSLSGNEENSAKLIGEHLERHGINCTYCKNNVWALNEHFDPNLPTLLLNSHHDTVEPSNGYTLDPFTPLIKDGKLFGLGSNDAGAALVSLIAIFKHYYQEKNLPYNLALACTAEEEISGQNGIVATLPKLPPITAAIIGEPTGMEMAVAEKGLMVLECVSHGKSGHAARDEGENALYKALDDIQWLRSYAFEEVSELLGPVKMTTTIITAGSQHNVVPDRCQFTVDVRTTDKYTNDQVLEIIRSQISADISPRSLRLNPSSIHQDHPLVKAGVSIGLSSYGSPTLSDQSLISVPSLKLGPGLSARSHTPDEYVLLSEVKNGIDLYIQLLDQLLH